MCVHMVGKCRLLSLIIPTRWLAVMSCHPNCCSCSPGKEVGVLLPSNLSNDLRYRVMTTAFCVHRSRLTCRPITRGLSSTVFRSAGERWLSTSRTSIGMLPGQLPDPHLSEEYPDMRSMVSGRNEALPHGFTYTSKCKRMFVLCAFAVYH